MTVPRQDYSDVPAENIPDNLKTNGQFDFENRAVQKDEIQFIISNFMKIDETNRNHGTIGVISNCKFDVNGKATMITGEQIPYDCPH